MVEICEKLQMPSDKKLTYDTKVVMKLIKCSAGHPKSSVHSHL